MENNFIKTYLLEKFDTSDIEIIVPNIYKEYRNETRIGYLMLQVLYYEQFNQKFNQNDITRDINGKPIFINKNIYFNISHSKNFIACSLASINIGIDLEEERKISNNAANKFLSESDIINPLKGWNIKEAYSKYLGFGLKLNFKTTTIENINKNCNLQTREIKIGDKYILFSLCYDILEDNTKNNLKITKKNNLLDFYYSIIKD